MTNPEALMAGWRTLITRCAAVPDTERVGRELLTSWAGPGRGYHNVEHLQDVLTHVDELAAHAGDLVAVRLAAWYHDAVYDGDAADEENSALRAEAELGGLGLDAVLVAEVARLVRMTATHDPAPGDRNGETLSDADLAILAAPAERYARYAAAIRAEYAHVPDDAFRAGRGKLLRALLDKPALFRTPQAQALWEKAARRNAEREISELA